MPDTRGDGELAGRDREREKVHRGSPSYKQTAGREFTTKKRDSERERKREGKREKKTERALPFLLFRGPAMFDQIDCEAVAVRVN